jgi:hypothetical protein
MHCSGPPALSEWVPPVVCPRINAYVQICTHHPTHVSGIEATVLQVTAGRINVVLAPESRGY